METETPVRLPARVPLPPVLASRASRLDPASELIFYKAYYSHQTDTRHQTPGTGARTTSSGMPGIHAMVLFLAYLPYLTEVHTHTSIE